MSESMIVRARADRKSPATLKTLLSHLRSKYPEDPILIFEGAEDIGPYETWINSFVEGEVVKMLPGNGKEQVLALRNMLHSDKTGLAQGTYLFVDRDYDDLQGQAPGSDIFCCDQYSVENYLSSELVVQSTLRDEFRLQLHSSEFASALALYRQAIRSLSEAIYPINFHIFSCRKLGIHLKQSVPELKRFVKIELTGACLLDDPDQLISKYLPTCEALPEDQVLPLKAEFSTLDPLTRHRGKFFYEFLRRWLECLIDEANCPSGKVFHRKVGTKFSLAAMTMRSCASRSARPSSLGQFVSNIYTGAGTLRSNQAFNSEA